MVLCQAVYQSIGEEEWIEMHEQCKSLQTDGSEESDRRWTGPGKVAWRSTQNEPFFSAKDKQVEAFGRRSALRESLLSLWQVDINQAFQVFEDRPDAD